MHSVMQPLPLSHSKHFVTTVISLSTLLSCPWKPSSLLSVSKDSPILGKSFNFDELLFIFFFFGRMFLVLYLRNNCLICSFKDNLNIFLAAIFLVCVPFWVSYFACGMTRVPSSFSCKWKLFSCLRTLFKDCSFSRGTVLAFLSKIK